VLLGVAAVTVIPNPRKSEVTRFTKLISENDAPILASALRSSDYLVTLDNEFSGEPVRAAIDKKSLRAVRPKDLIEEIRRRQAA
jgi:hypothetical protein